MSQPTTSPAIAWKTAMYNTTKTLFAADARDVLISFGAPVRSPDQDAILFLDVTETQDYATLSASNRSREVLLTMDVLFFSRFNGEADEDLAPTNRVAQLIAAVELYSRTTDTTWGGTVRECFLTNQEWVGYTPSEVRGGGRAVDCRATFTAKQRISNY